MHINRRVHFKMDFRSFCRVPFFHWTIAMGNFASKYLTWRKFCFVDLNLALCLLCPIPRSPSALIYLLFTIITPTWLHKNEYLLDIVSTLGSKKPFYCVYFMHRTNHLLISYHYVWIVHWGLYCMLLTYLMWSTGDLSFMCGIFCSTWAVSLRNKLIQIWGCINVNMWWTKWRLQLMQPQQYGLNFTLDN